MGPDPRRFLVCACMALGPCGTGWAQPIGELMKPDRMVIRGATAFTPDQVRTGLYRSLESGLTAKPSMPTTEYLELVRGQLLAGYARSGYGQSQITVAVDQEGNAGRRGRRHPGRTALCVRTGSCDGSASTRRQRSSVQTSESRTHWPVAAQCAEIANDRPFIEFEEVGTEPPPDEPLWPTGTPAYLHEKRQQDIRQRAPGDPVRRGIRRHRGGNTL